MAEKTLIFSANQLIATDNDPNFNRIELATFDGIDSEDLESTEITRRESGEKETLEVRKIIKIIYEERFIGIYQQEGKKYPYSPVVVDSSHTEQTNPRNPDQIEFSSQLFALIDTLTSRIYISDQRKKNVICDWISKKINKTITVKAILDESEFIARIKKIESITIATLPDLFNSTLGTTLSSHLVQDIYGFEADRASLKFEYNLKSPSDRVKERIKNLIGQKSDYTQITVVGLDDGGMENILNLDGITSNIELKVAVDENQMVSMPGMAFEGLISIIKANE